MDRGEWLDSRLDRLIPSEAAMFILDRGLGGFENQFRRYGEQKNIHLPCRELNTGSLTRNPRI
jgi:hypothetical protein